MMTLARKLAKLTFHGTWNMGATRKQSTRAQTHTHTPIHITRSAMRCDVLCGDVRECEGSESKRKVNFIEFFTLILNHIIELIRGRNFVVITEICAYFRIVCGYHFCCCA